MQAKPAPELFHRIRWPLRLTWAGLWAERLSRAFWPLWTVLLLVLSVLAFGLQDILPLEAAWTGLVAACVGAGWALWRGLRRFNAPRRTEALARLDASLPGQPISALTDEQAVGGSDPASVAVWLAHRARMTAQRVRPRPRRRRGHDGRPLVGRLGPAAALYRQAGALPQ
jgi:hypothetical protein